MQANWPKSLAFTLEREGGWYDDPRGGPTEKGITLATYRNFTGNMDLMASDLQNISDDEVSQIYKKGFWDKMLCDSLPAGVDVMVFDFGVPSGWMNSLYILQKALNVTVDGNIGDVTTKAMAAISGTRLVELLRERQWTYYGEVHGASTQLIKSWRNRLTLRAYLGQDLAKGVTYV